jgi:hypothetical protein
VSIFSHRRALTPDVAQGAEAKGEELVRAEVAMPLLGIEHLQRFCDAEEDTCCIVGWGPQSIVVAYRGTASARNWMADIQVTLKKSKKIGIVHPGLRACLFKKKQ